MTTNSIVTYLNSIGVDSSYSNRAKLAKQHGISNYKGTAAQNTKLLNILRKGSTNKSTTNYKGKRVESIHNGNLRLYSKPSWRDNALAGTVKKAYGFATIVDNVKLGKGCQYRVKNGKEK